MLFVASTEDQLLATVPPAPLVQPSVRFSLSLKEMETVLAATLSVTFVSAVFSAVPIYGTRCPSKVAFGRVNLIQTAPEMSEVRLPSRSVQLFEILEKVLLSLLAS